MGWCISLDGVCVFEVSFFKKAITKHYMQSLFGEKVNHIDEYKSNYVKINTEYL